MTAKPNRLCAGVRAIAASGTAAGRATPRAAARLGHAATIDYREVDTSYEARHRQHIMNRDWAGVHIAADRRAPFAFILAKQEWR